MLQAPGGESVVEDTQSTSPRAGVLARASHSLRRKLFTARWGTALDSLLLVWSRYPGSEGIANHSTGTLDDAPLAGHEPDQRAPSGDMASENKP